MVTMFRGARWKIAVYGRDHGVPHFYIEGPDFRCSVAIATLELIVGTVPTAVLKDALEWARSNQASHEEMAGVERMNVTEKTRTIAAARAIGPSALDKSWSDDTAADIEIGAILDDRAFAAIPASSPRSR